ncbi:HN1_G0026190.mRNA.1.CDS.1 [Saccharomyces cerevisiae]|nr:HN1_G0026190.mRNA.1.CDS.1 [Saccharomyces cerevisiae]CAI4587505.1 BAL_1a_G0033930.mRNA.1.CDS.1 [Saccharomyces cerevisiae]CAI7214483.1 BAL_1a_G0033930.mRNA.1.CDS.1 [Saccharomyces cerevisiae]
MCMCMVSVYFSILLHKGTKVLYTHDNYWLVILVFYFLAFGSILRISGRTCSEEIFRAGIISQWVAEFLEEITCRSEPRKKENTYFMLHHPCNTTLPAEVSNKRLGNPHLNPTRESTFSRELATENNSGNFPVLFRYHISRQLDIENGILLCQVL